MSKSTQTLNKINYYLVLLTVFLFPLFFNPYSANLFNLNKTILLAISTAIILSLWMISNILNRSFRFTLTPFTLPLVLLSLVILITSYGPIPQFIESFITTTSIPLFLTLLFLAATTIKTPKNAAEQILKAIVASGALLGIFAILESIDLGPGKWISSIFSSITQTNGLFITPAGSVVILITFLIPALLISLLLAFEKKNYMEKSLLFVASGLMTASLVISSFNVLPGKTNSPVFIPFNTSWQIAAENIKQPKTFLLGVGPSNFIQAFSLHKPADFNNNEFWNTRFNVARNLPLHIFTTSGIIGLTAWAILILSIFRTIKQANSLSNTARIALVATVAIIITSFIIPENLVLKALTVFLLIAVSLELKHTSTGASEFLLKLFAAKKVTGLSQDQQLKTELLPILVGIPTVILSLLVFYGSYRVISADVYFRKALEAATQNNGTNTYNFQRQAITQNPFLSSYHRSYSNTNLALANALSAQGNPSDQDRQNITQLIRQAIREARTATLINPKDPTNWETLASTYRNLINVADNAQQWTTASYSEAIKRDPTNPRLRVELGGVFYQLGDYPSAIRLFEQAVGLKPNWANAHYNLASAYREAGQLQAAVSQFDQVLALVDPTTADYAKAQEEQNQIKTKLGEETNQTQSQTSQISSPDPLPQPLDQQIQLDESEAAPPSESDSTLKNTRGTGFSDITAPETGTESQEEQQDSSDQTEEE